MVVNLVVWKGYTVHLHVWFLTLCRAWLLSHVCMVEQCAYSVRGCCSMWRCSYGMQLAGVDTILAQG